MMQEGCYATPWIANIELRMEMSYRTIRILKISDWLDINTPTLSNAVIGLCVFLSSLSCLFFSQQSAHIARKVLCKPADTVALSLRFLKVVEKFSAFVALKDNRMAGCFASSQFCAATLPSSRFLTVCLKQRRWNRGALGHAPPRFCKKQRRALFYF